MCYFYKVKECDAILRRKCLTLIFGRQQPNGGLPPLKSQRRDGLSELGKPRTHSLPSVPSPLLTRGGG